MGNIRDDIQKLGRKIAAKRDEEREIRNEGDESTYVSAAKIGFRITTELLSGVLVGAGLGFVLDALLGTHPLFLVVLLLFGGAAGFLNVYRLSKSEEAKKGEE